MSSQLMLAELVVEAPFFSPFFIFNFLSAIFVMLYCIVKFCKNNYVLARVSFCFSAFMCCFYQVPLVLFSPQVSAALQHPWRYALVINGGALVLVFWGVISSRLDFSSGPTLYPRGTSRIYVATGIIGVLLLAIYLTDVSWACTGLYALLFDPWLTLLAREFSVKLIGSSFSTYSLGAYANSVAPVFVLLSVWLIKESLARRRIFGVFIGFIGGFLAIFALLISGTKGLLMPLMIMLVAGSYFWCGRWFSRILTAVFAILFVGSTLVTFELFKERRGVVGSEYDFAGCSARAGTCQSSLSLLESMTARSDSLGLPTLYVKPIQTRLECLCSGAGDEVSCPSGTLNGMVRGDTVSKLGALPLSDRAVTFFHALVGRMFIVPFQVSVWNFMYGETESIEGIKTLPFARRILGESLNMPELVYQKYGSVYSRGDKTSTSTSPTSFFFAYPAYLGLSGFLIALICVVALDFFMANMVRLIAFSWSSLMPILVGIVMVMCMNFMTSDFVTVLISHGGAAGILLLLIHGLLLKKTI